MFAANLAPYGKQVEAMRYFFILMLVGCVPKRDLPDWKVKQMHRRADTLAPCGSFSKGQSLGDGIRVKSIRTGHVYVRMGNGETLAIPCR